MATITKTPSGTWKAIVRKVGWPTQAKTFRLKRDASDWGRRTEDEMVRGVYVDRSAAERLTLSQALDRYLKEVTPTKRASTQATDPRKAVPLRAALGEYSLAAITPDIVADYRDARLATVSERTGRPLSNNSVRLELALLGHLYTTAIREWRLGLVANPVQMVRRPAPGEGRLRRLREDEEQYLLAACDAYSNPMVGWIVRVALWTAMRQGEILSLTADQVDVEGRAVHLSQTKNGSRRTVPLSSRAAEVLRAALGSRLRGDSPFVFAGELGRPDAQGRRRRGHYQIHTPWRHVLQRADEAYQEACRKIGVDPDPKMFHDLRFHDLRHEAISRLVEADIPDQQVAAISGHKSMQMLQRYAHLRNKKLVGVVESLEL